MNVFATAYMDGLIRIESKLNNKTERKRFVLFIVLKAS